jgi:hypothetical protein
MAQRYDELLKDANKCRGKDAFSQKNSIFAP